MKLFMIYNVTVIVVTTKNDDEQLHPVIFMIILHALYVNLYL
jgi:hypothetical protein